MLATTKHELPEIHPVLRARDILWIQQLVRQLPATEHMIDYAVDLARATRPEDVAAPEFVKNWLAWGAGPRAAQYLVLGGKARALLKGRYAVGAEDIRAVALPVLRHRIFTNFNADAEGINADAVVQKLIESVKEPGYGEPSIAPARSHTGPSQPQQGTAPPSSQGPPTPPPPPPPAGEKDRGHSSPAWPPDFSDKRKEKN